MAYLLNQLRTLIARLSSESEDDDDDEEEGEEGSSSESWDSRSDTDTACSMGGHSFSVRTPSLKIVTPLEMTVPLILELSNMTDVETPVSLTSPFLNITLILPEARILVPGPFAVLISALPFCTSISAPLSTAPSTFKLPDFIVTLAFFPMEP